MLSRWAVAVLEISQRWPTVATYLVMGTIRDSIAVLGVGVALGCGHVAAERSVTRTARNEHNCPPEQINILSKSGDGQTFEVEVCGRKRTYRDEVPGDGKWEFVEQRRKPRHDPSEPLFEEKDETGLPSLEEPKGADAGAADGGTPAEGTDNKAK